MGVTVERKHYLVPVCAVNGVTVEGKHYLVPVCAVNGEKALSGPSVCCEWV